MNINCFSKRIMAGGACLGALALVAGVTMPSLAAAPVVDKSPQARDKQKDDDRDEKGRLRHEDRDRKDDDRRDNDRDRWDDDRDEKGRLRRDDAKNKSGWGKGPRDKDDRWDRDRRDRDRWDRDRDRRDDRWGDWGVGGYRGSVSWSDIDRRPSLGNNSAAGFYVWRERDDVYIVANDQDRGRYSRYSGEVLVQNGSFSNVDGYDTEGSDRVARVGDNRIRFDFDTNDDRDGVRFRVNSGSRIVITLRGDSGNGDRIYVGRDRLATRQNPLVIVR